MDPITTAIIAALSSGAVSSLTETSKTTITDAYSKLKDLFSKKFGAKSNVVQAIESLETSPASSDYKKNLQEEVVVVQATQDDEIVAAAHYLMAQIQPQQIGPGKFFIQNNALVQGQNISDNQQITQYFSNPPKAEG